MQFIPKIAARQAPRRRFFRGGVLAVCLMASGLFPVTSAAASAGTSVPPSCPPAARGQVTCFAMFRAAPQPLTNAAVGAGATNPAGYGPADLASAYQIPSTDTTATVAIVTAYDDPDVASNLEVYRAQYGLAGCGTACLQVVDEYGGSNLPTQQAADWIGETDLDVQMAAATCPTCQITVVEANSQAATDMYQAVQTAAALSHFVVMSWGSPEWSRVAAKNTSSFSTPGVAYVAASGDYGWGRANFPASSPNVLAVGGTTLQRSLDPRGWTEQVWNSGDGRASGSGCSSYFAQPLWQQPSAAGVCPGRAVADVSLVADPADGVAVYTDPAPGTDAGPTWTVAGGTSVGAPIAAAMYAVAGTPTDYDFPSAYPYYHQANDNVQLNDVTTGDNLFLDSGCTPSAQCTAGPGYDAPSGLGTPVGVAAFAPVQPVPVSIAPINERANFAGTPTSLRVSASTDDSLARISYSADNLPPGLQLNSATGRITGTPTQAGRYSVTVLATSSGGTSAQTTFAWQIADHALVPGTTPHVVGSPTLGSTLHVRFGRWHQDRPRGPVLHPQTAFHWFANGHRIRGATEASFTVPRRRRWLQRQIEARVSAHLDGYSPYAASTASTAPIARAS